MIEILKEILSDVVGSVTLRPEVVETMIRELETRGLLTAEETGWVRREVEAKSTMIRSHLGERLSLLEGMVREVRSGLGFASGHDLDRLTEKVGSIEAKLDELAEAIGKGDRPSPDSKVDD